MSSQYQPLYGVGLLDDLHNYFPALLYDSSSFRSVRDVLSYIQIQTRNRFDLFSRGLREYTAADNPPPLVAAPSAPVPSRRVVPPVPLNTIQRNRRNENSTLFPPSYTGATMTVNMIDTDEEDSAITRRLLLSLLNAPLLNTPTAFNNNINYDAFMQPVPIRPTPEQIAASTTVGNLASDEEHSCAICQDALQPEQEGRKLNRCGHWFHRSCIDTWFETNPRCPVCREDIRDPPPVEE